MAAYQRTRGEGSGTKWIDTEDQWSERMNEEAGTIDEAGISADPDDLFEELNTHQPSVKEMLDLANSLPGLSEVETIPSPMIKDTTTPDIDNAEISLMRENAERQKLVFDRLSKAKPRHSEPSVQRQVRDDKRPVPTLSSSYRVAPPASMVTRKPRIPLALVNPFVPPSAPLPLPKGKEIARPNERADQALPDKDTFAKAPTVPSSPLSDPVAHKTPAEIGHSSESLSVGPYAESFVSQDEVSDLRSDVETLSSRISSLEGAIRAMTADREFTFRSLENMRIALTADLTLMQDKLSVSLENRVDRTEMDVGESSAFHMASVLDDRKTGEDTHVTVLSGAPAPSTVLSAARKKKVKVTK